MPNWTGSMNRQRQSTPPAYYSMPNLSPEEDEQQYKDPHTSGC